MSKVSKYVLIVFFVFVFAAYFWKAYITLDPDLGWRVAAGYLYISSGIPLTDPFSYTMSSFPWVDHAWFVSLVIGFLHPLVGKTGLSILFSLLATAALLISGSRRDKFVKLNIRFFNKLELPKEIFRWIDIPFILSFVIILPFSGVRAQVSTWLLLSILLKIILTGKNWTKYRLYLPIFFAVWSNIHGGAASGLMVLFLVLSARIIKRKRICVVDFSIFMGSLLATLINPHGVGFWREIYSSISDSSLRWSVAEWMPAVIKMDFAFVFYACLSLIFVTKYRKKFKLEQLFLYYLFFIQAIASLRHISLWIIISAPTTSSAIYYFYSTVKNNKDSLYRFTKIYKGAWLLALIFFIIQVATTLHSSRSLSEEVFYPENAVEYLKVNGPEGEIFSNYGWGGYLIWKYPEKKVFIDGRMPSWRWQANIEGEENAVFDTYQEILSGDIDYKEQFEKYNIDTVLWPKPRSFSVYDKLQGSVENFLVLFGREKQDFDFIESLENDKWIKSYEDNVAVVFRKS
jgi:hypothetical protein